MAFLASLLNFHFESEASMRKKTKRQTKIQKNGVTKIRRIFSYPNHHNDIVNL